MQGPIVIPGVGGGGGGFDTAGTGLTSSGTTVNFIANADGSLVANANDAQVGVLASDAQHGNRGGGGIHANAVAAGAAGFMTGADKTKIDGIASGATNTSSPINLIYGRGNSGAVTATTASLSANVYATTWTSAAAQTTTMAGFIIRGTVSITLQAADTIITANGGAGAAGGTAGAAVGSAAVGGSTAGGAGGTAGGSNGAAAGASSLGGAGGNGGLGGSGAGGSGITPTAIVVNRGSTLSDILSAAFGLAFFSASVAVISGGAGGGGGGGDGTSGGGGGGGGGVAILCAPTIANAGIVRADGGAGGSPAAGNRGGGGGGGGGVLITIANAYTGAGTYTANGGAHGVKQGTGVDGNDGSPGNVFQLTI